MLMWTEIMWCQLLFFLKIISFLPLAYFQNKEMSLCSHFFFFFMFQAYNVNDIKKGMLNINSVN